ncbi:MAG TPA: ATP-dependent DNA ligase [Candidatus Limnocylindrales bacterium]
MLGWSELADRVAGTTRTSEKTSLLARYLATLPVSELRPAATFLAGRPFAEVDPRSVGLGWATIAAVVSKLAGTPAGALGAAYDHSSDLGQAVADVLSMRPEDPDSFLSPSLEEVADAFAQMEAAVGSAARAAVFAALLERCDAISAKYVVKILTGELRIGLREGLLEAAIAEAFGRPQETVGMAMMLTGNTGEAAVLAMEDRLDEARLCLLHPIKFMLATPAENAADVITRLGPTVWVEDKYDGIRAQLHRRGSEVRLYSRDMHDISSQFPEIVAAAGPLDWDGILDGEILAYADGHVLPFLTLQGRIGRKEPTLRLQAEIPVAYVAFDLLAVGPRLQAAEPMLAVPLSERRRRLEALNLPTVADGGRFALSHLVCAESVDELERSFSEARARRNEGLMVKDPNSGYSPGRRGLGWLKMKKALATLDCVVVGVEEGHGKRHGVLSDYTFAVRDESGDRLVTIGKAYTGLTDAEIAEMTGWFESHTIHRLGRFRQVHPIVVVEVAFDVIQRSDRHQSGYALRFPRIVRLRIDKSPTEIDTLANVERLHRELQYGAEYLITAGAKATEARAKDAKATEPA